MLAAARAQLSLSLSLSYVGKNSECPGCTAQRRLHVAIRLRSVVRARPYVPCGGELEEGRRNNIREGDRVKGVAGINSRRLSTEHAGKKIPWCAAERLKHDKRAIRNKSRRCIRFYSGLYGTDARICGNKFLPIRLSPPPLSPFRSISDLFGYFF